MAVSAALFLTWQVLYFAVAPDRDATVRNVDLVRSAGLLAWAGALLALFASGGTLIRRARIRDFLDDERTLALRAASYRTAFWVVIAICFAGYAAGMFTQLRAVDLAHVALSAGVLALLGSYLYADRG